MVSDLVCTVCLRPTKRTLCINGLIICSFMYNGSRQPVLPQASLIKVLAVRMKKIRAQQRLIRMDTFSDRSEFSLGEPFCMFCNAMAQIRVLTNSVCLDLLLFIWVITVSLSTNLQASRDKKITLMFRELGQGLTLAQLVVCVCAKRESERERERERERW